MPPETVVPPEWRDSHEPARRLAYWVKARRTELDVTQLDVWQAGGPSNTTLTKIEKGLMSTLNRKTARALDKGLAWVDGSARGIFADASPPTPAPPAGEPTISIGEARRVILALDISEERKAAMLALLEPPTGGEDGGDTAATSLTG